MICPSMSYKEAQIIRDTWPSLYTYQRILEDEKKKNTHTIAFARAIPSVACTRNIPKISPKRATLFRSRVLVFYPMIKPSSRLLKAVCELPSCVLLKWGNHTP